MTSSRTWLITGCSSGFGRALAEAALADGDRVWLTARSIKSLEELAARYPEHARLAALDVTRPQDAERVLGEAERADGIDILVNNAGYGLIGAVEEATPEELRTMFDVNFFGLLEVIRTVLPGMRRRRRGHILNLSSVAGLTASAGYGLYGASKFAVEGVSEALAKELKPLGIHVTLVEPGRFRTGFIGRSLRLTEGVIADYAATSGKVRDTILDHDGRQPGDPARAAQVILAATKTDTPPLHLPLGDDAYQMLRQKVAALLQDAEAWEAQAGKATAYPEDA